MIWRRWKLLVILLAMAGGLSYWSWRHYAAARRLTAWEDEQRQLESVFAALERPIAVSRGQLLLPEFAALIAEKTNLAVNIDADFLSRYVIPQTQVELPLATLPAKMLLKLGLQPLQLDYTIAGGQVVITTPDIVAAAPLRVVTYALPQLDPSAADSQAWADLVTGFVEPTEWEPVGGRGWCEATPGALVVAQRPEIHAQIRALFGQLGKLRSPPANWQAVPLWPPSLATIDADVVRKLDRPASLDCRDEPLDRVIQRLATQHDASLFLVAELLKDNGINPQTPVTFQLSGVSLDSLLHHLLADLDLTFVVESGVVHIMTPNDAESRRATVAYPVHDLLRRGDEDALRSLCEAVAPQSWDAVGGPGALSHSFGGWLFVLQTNDVHEQLGGLLAALRSALTEPPLRPVEVRRSANERKILAALEQPFSVHYDGLRLVDIAADLTELLQIPVRLRPVGTGVGHQTPVSAEFSEAPARTQLERILAPLGLTFVVDHECLLIATREDAEKFQVTSVFDARPLIDPELGLFGRLQFRNDEALLELLGAHVDYRSWDIVGGPGSLAGFRGLLAIHQTRENTRRLAWLLEELQSSLARREQPGVRPTAMFFASELRIQTALEQEIAWSSSGMSLPVACSEAGQRIGVPIHVRERWIRDNGGDPAVLIFGDYPTATARVQLHRLCDALGLAFDVRDDGVLITTRDEVESRLATRIYDVRSLVDPASGLYAAGRPGAGMPRAPNSAREALCDLVTSHVQPQTWNSVGGVGVLHCPGGLLVVTQSWLALGEVERLLGDLRRGRTELPAAEQRIFATLGEELPVSYREAPLPDVCRDLSRRLQIPVRVYERAIRAVGIDPRLPLSGEFPAAPAWIQLQRLCRKPQLAFTVRNETLLLTTGDDAYGRLATRVYDVRALLGQKHGFIQAAYATGFGLLGKPLSRPASRPVGDELVDLITESVDPASWDSVGGPGVIRWAGSLLVVTQTDACHREVGGLLAALQAHCLPDAAQPALSSAVWALPDPDSSRIFEQLSQPVRLELRGVPLTEALQRLSRTSGIPIEFDPDELLEEPPPITLADRIPLHEVLARILPEEVQFTIDAGQLLVTDAERCEQNLRTRFYPVGDLVAGEPLDSLAKRIRREVRPTSWDMAQGYSTIGLVQSAWLVVAADSLTHLHLDAWLNRQRAANASIDQ